MSSSPLAGKGHIVISTDSHTEAIVDLKPKGDGYTATITVGVKAS